jgi:rhodanese-related sulfurtransferase
MGSSGDLESIVRHICRSRRSWAPERPRLPVGLPGEGFGPPLASNRSLMTPIQPRRSAIHRPPPEISAKELRRALWSKTAPSIFDVRNESAFRTGHLASSINAPDSRTTTLVKRVQEAERVVLVCDDGRVSAMVARTLGVCGFPDVAYLKGGLRAWLTEGGDLMETTRSGNERPVSPVDDSSRIDKLAPICVRLNPRLLLIGLAAGCTALFVVARLMAFHG